MAKIIDCGKCFYFATDDSICFKKRKVIRNKIIKCRYFRLKDISDDNYLFSDEEMDIIERIRERNKKSKIACLFAKILRKKE